MTYDALKILHRDGKGNIILDEMLKIWNRAGSCIGIAKPTNMTYIPSCGASPTTD